MKDGQNIGQENFSFMGNIKIANAPCSWGALEFGLEEETQSFQEVLDEMEATGYVGTELGDWGFLPTDPKELRKVMDEKKFQVPGAFVPVFFSDENSHEEGIEKALKIAALLVDAGFDDAFIILADENGMVEARTKNAGRVTPEMGLSDEKWQIFAKGVNKIAKAVKDKFGLRTVFHHHCAGYVETGMETQRLLELTEPDLVGLCLDMGHLAFGGGDPVSFLKKNIDRIWHVHFKDFDPNIGALSKANDWDYFESVKQGVFCKLGEGAVDFPQIIKILNDNEYSGWIVVEQDVLPGMGSPKLCAAHNRGYINKLGL